MARGVLNSETEFHIFSLHLMMAKLAVHNRAVKVFSYMQRPFLAILALTCTLSSVKSRKAKCR